VATGSLENAWGKPDNYGWCIQARAATIQFFRSDFLIDFLWRSTGVTTTFPFFISIPFTSCNIRLHVPTTPKNPHVLFMYVCTYALYKPQPRKTKNLLITNATNQSLAKEKILSLLCNHFTPCSLPPRAKNSAVCNVTLTDSTRR
jgi:hypothetical protein